jgi:hypothetical protein
LQLPVLLHVIPQESPVALCCPYRCKPTQQKQE